MESIKRSIKVHASVEVVYARWTRFEEYPAFMSHIIEVRREGENRFYWRAERDGIPYEAVEEVSLMIPNRRIAWRNVSGSENSGVVSFEPDGAEDTVVTLDMAYVPDSGWHSPAKLEGRIGDILESFRDLVEPGGVMEDLVSHNWRGF
jgi:uncharacterized membrane protein